MESLHVVAGIIVQRGKVFAARRQAGGPAGLMWEFPGGKVESGESAIDALVRELSEELSVTVSVRSHLGLFSTPVGNRVIDLDCYFATIVEGTIQLTSHVESRWLTLDEVNGLDWAGPDVPVIERLRALGDDALA